jgi:aspartate/methionine/tyrosine aminotransferase
MFESKIVTPRIRKMDQVEIVSFLGECKKQAKPGLIDLSIGNPDIPPCPEALNELLERSRDPNMHGYGNFNGVGELLEGIGAYYKQVFKTEVNPQEIMVVRGIRSAIFDVATVFAGSGDYILLPSVSYPSYFLATEFCGASTYLIPSSEESDYLPDLTQIPLDVVEKAKILYLNYPHNPTGAVITRDKLEEIVEFAHKNSILLCYDNAYNEIVFDGIKPLSLMEIEGAREVGIELFSFSKLTSLAGWRISFIAGGETIIKEIREYLSLTDTAPYNGFQYGAAVALKQTYLDNTGAKLGEHYQKRRDELIEVLETIGLDYYKSMGGFYIWVKSPKGDGRSFTNYLLNEANILVVPGDYYGEDGTNYVRLSLTTSEDDFQEVLKRLKRLTL